MKIFVISVDDKVTGSANNVVCILHLLLNDMLNFSYGLAKVKV